MPLNEYKTSRSNYNSENILFDAYTRGIGEWLKANVQIDEAIKIQFTEATPQNAFAKVVKPLLNGSYIGPADAIYYLSAMRRSDFQHGGDVFRVRHIQIPGTDEIYKNLVYKAPKIYQLFYTVVLYTLEQKYNNILIHQLLTKCDKNSPSCIMVNEQFCTFYIDGDVIDNSELEPGIDKSKIIRNELTLKVDRAYLETGWIEEPAIKKIKTINRPE